MMHRATQVVTHGVYSTALATAAKDYLIIKPLVHLKLPVASNVSVPSGCLTALRSSTSLCRDVHIGLLNTLGALMMGSMLELSFVFEIVVFTAS